MRILGLDMGEKRIGVAVCDELGLTAQGVGVIHRTGSLDADIEAVRVHVEEYGATDIVVGLPLRMDGSEREEAQGVRAVAVELERRLAVPVHPWDERLSTREAERHLIAADVSRKRRKQVVDKLAACIILQGYLDWRRLNEGVREDEEEV